MQMKAGTPARVGPRGPAAGVLSRMRFEGGGTALGVAGATFLLSRACLLELFFPFGLAAYLAVLLTRRDLALAAALGLTAGALSVTPATAGLQQLAALAACSLAAHYAWRGPNSSPGAWATWLTATAAATAAGAAVAALSRQPPALIGLHLADGALAGGLTLLFLAPARLALGDEFPSRFAVEVGAVIAAAAAAGGLAGLSLGPLDLHRLAEDVVILAAATGGGLGSATASALALGLLRQVSFAQFAAAMGRLGLAGAGAGLLAVGGPVAAALGLAAGRLALEPRPAPELAAAIVIETALGLAAVLLGTRLGLWRHLVRGEDEGRQGRPPGGADYRSRLSAASRVLRQTAAMIAAAGEGAVDAAGQRRRVALGFMARRVCGACPRRQECWAHDEPERDEELIALVGAGAREGRAAWDDLGPWLTRHCRCREQLVAGAGWASDLLGRDAYWIDRLAECRRGTAEALRALARIVSEVAGQRRRPPRECPSARTLSLRAEAAQSAGCSSGVNGDSYRVFEPDQSRLAVALSDGMGQGEKAARQSGETLDLLQTLLRAGFDDGAAVCISNAFLLLRTPEESCVTLDLLLFDRRDGRAQMTKVGACPTFLWRDGVVHALGRPAPPAGILPDAGVFHREMRLAAGDRLVMISDGVLQTASRDRFIRYLERSLRPLPAAADLARQLLTWCPAATDGLPGRADDASVLVVDVVGDSL